MWRLVVWFVGSRGWLTAGLWQDGVSRGAAASGPSGEISSRIVVEKRTQLTPQRQQVEFTLPRLRSDNQEPAMPGPA